MSASQALTPDEQAALATSAYYLFVSKYYALAATAVLILFTSALFNRDARVVALVSTTLIAQLVVTGWSLGAVTYVPLPPGFSGCIYAGKSGTGIRIQTSWFMQLGFISVVFGLMIWKAASLQRFKMKAPLVTVLTRDGLKYFGTIFSVNFVNVMNFTLVKNDDIKSLHATFSALLTVIMINRLILGVREETKKNAEGSMTESMMASTSLVVFTMETQTGNDYAVVDTYEMPKRCQHHVDLVSVESIHKKQYVVV
ncbi:hypothetical protein H0H92_007139 [Tricholoma furcatifolium]|nr:hypothetical protein H0H92_007139 [Tricholoma furcatifolium]